MKIKDAMSIILYILVLYYFDLILLARITNAVLLFRLIIEVVFRDEN